MALTKAKLIADNAVKAVHIDETDTGITLAQLNVTGDITATNVAGTLSTAAQPNITSVGTLSSLAVSGDLTVDTNTLYVDASSNEVGIGTSSPNAKLTVADAALSTISLTATGEATDQKTWIHQYGTSVGAGTYRLRAVNDALTNGQNAVIITRTGVNVDTHQFLTSGTERLRIDSSGNLGIGTSSPLRRLHVLSGTGIAQFQSNTSAGDIYLGDASSSSIDNQGIGSRGNNIVISAGGLERMRIDSSGNVGIGVSPDSWNTIKPIQLGNAGNFFAGFQGGSAIYMGAAAYYNSGWKYATTGSAANMIDIGNGNFVFQNAPSGTVGSTLTWSERMRIDSSGNVGIGTTPAAKLEVKGSTSGFRLITSNATSATFSMLTDLGLGYDNAAQLIAGQSSTNNAHLIFATKTSGSVTEKMRIHSSGNISIGSSNIDYGKLDITVNPSAYTGALALGVRTASSEGDSVGISFKTNIALGGSVVWENARIAAITNNINSSAYGSLAFYTMNATNLSEKMRITSGGEVIAGATVISSGNTTPIVKGITSDSLVVGRKLPANGGYLGLWQTNSLEWKYYTNQIGYIMTFEPSGVISGDFNDTSDRNLKENINSITDGLSIISQLQPKTFDWKNKNKLKNQAGFIAQEVEIILPDSVYGNDYIETDGNPDSEPQSNGKSINSTAILAYAVKSIQQLKEIIDNQQIEIDNLKAQLNG